MKIHEMMEAAPEKLARASQEKKIVLIYVGILAGLSVVLTLASQILGSQIDQAGGLSNLGLRSTLLTVNNFLPLVQMVLSLCLALGYRSAMLRIARGQAATPQGLRLGFDRFWLLLRTTLLKGMIYLAVAFACSYLASFLFLLTPLSRRAMDVLLPVASQMTSISTMPVIDDAVIAQLMPAMAPMILIFVGLFALLAIPIALRYRMSDFVIIDKPGTGAFAALRASRSMMRGNCMNLVKVDLHLWWYYAGMLLCQLLCYGNVLLPMVGISLPFSPQVSFYLFYVLYLGAQFALTYFFSNRVAVTYALAYEAIRPVEQSAPGVVLGNIFQM